MEALKTIFAITFSSTDFMIYTVLWITTIVCVFQFESLALISILPMYITLSRMSGIVFTINADNVIEKFDDSHI